MSKKLPHVTSLVLGDWSDDGHGKTDITSIKSNLDPDQIMEAYKKGSKKLGFDFINEVAADYEDSAIDANQLQKLVDAGLDIEKSFQDDYSIKEAKEALENEQRAGLWVDSYRNIFLFIVKLGNDKFEYEIDNNAQLNIGGYGLFG